MSRENGNEMEQIQKNLERFLDREVAKYEKGEAGYREAEDMDEAEYDGEPEYERETEYDGESEYGDDAEYDEESEYEEDLYDEEDEPLYEEERYGGRRSGRYVHDEPGRVEKKDKGRKKPKKEKPDKEKPKKEKWKREEDKHAVMSRDKKKDGKKKKSRGKKILTVLAVLLVLFGAVWYLAIGSIYGKMRYNRVETLAGEPLKENGVVNILLIGSDSRTEGDDGRSDAIIDRKSVV